VSTSTSLVDGICEFTLETRDIGAMEAFYRDSFGLTVLDHSDDRTWLGISRHCRLGLWTPGPKEFGDEGGAHVHFAFAVAAGTLDELATKLRGRGLNVHGPKEHPGGDRSLYVEDPEGNIVEAWDYFDHAEGASQGIDGLASS
jgi:catechol-2,3-dioxygenase